MKKIIFVSVLFTLFNSILFAQNKAFEGVILDSQTKNPIVNATVNVVGSNTHTLTDKEGKFRIEVLEDAMLEIMHMSYQTLTVLASEASTINLSLKKISLDEIVIKSHPLDDISHSVVAIDGAKKGSQARNAAELFNDISSFSIQKRSATASEPSFRAFKYEQMNIKYDGGTKVVHACPNRMDPATAKETVPTPSSYTTFDIRAGVEPIKNLKLGAVALNIFDGAYYSHLNFSFKIQQIT